MPNRAQNPDRGALTLVFESTLSLTNAQQWKTMKPRVEEGREESIQKRDESRREKRDESERKRRADKRARRQEQRQNINEKGEDIKRRERERERERGGGGEPRRGFAVSSWSWSDLAVTTSLLPPGWDRTACDGYLAAEDRSQRTGCARRHSLSLLNQQESSSPFNILITMSMYITKAYLLSQGSKNRPPSGHLRLKNPVWRVKNPSSGQFGNWKLSFSGQVGD